MSDAVKWIERAGIFVVGTAFSAGIIYGGIRIQVDAMAKEIDSRKNLVYSIPTLQQSIKDIKENQSYIKEEQKYQRVILQNIAIKLGVNR